MSKDPTPAAPASAEVHVGHTLPAWMLGISMSARHAVYRYAEDYAAARDAEIAALRAERDLAPLCDEHRKPGGKRATCLVCACRDLSGALSRISYLCGEPNEMECGPYDVHCDESAVVEQVRALRAEVERLRVDAERAVGRTAARCREMAMWPQGIDDEQAFYGRLFAEFITKEFDAAIDAAMREEPKA